MSSLDVGLDVQSIVSKKLPSQSICCWISSDVGAAWPIATRGCGKSRRGILCRAFDVASLPQGRPRSLKIGDDHPPHESTMLDYVEIRRAGRYTWVERWLGGGVLVKVVLDQDVLAP